MVVATGRFPYLDFFPDFLDSLFIFETRSFLAFLIPFSLSRRHSFFVPFPSPSSYHYDELFLYSLHTHKTPPRNSSLSSL